ncbi:MAG: zf-TFIIB domain-containing protein, partial [Phormidium sp.]
MQCPKDQRVTLVDGTLSDNLAVKHCPDCQGNWISVTDYEAWVVSQAEKSAAPKLTARSVIDLNFVPSPHDNRAALCPECQHYLTRAKVFYKRAFYVERCTHCGGIWCD